MHFIHRCLSGQSRSPCKIIISIRHNNPTQSQNAHHKLHEEHKRNTDKWNGIEMCLTKMTWKGFKNGFESGEVF